jgi:hypothetical protein
VIVRGKKINEKPQKKKSYKIKNLPVPTWTKESLPSVPSWGLKPFRRNKERINLEDL